MLHTKNYPLFLSFLFLLLSCNDQKPKEKDSDTIIAATNPVPADTGNNAVFNTSSFNSAYISSIAQTFTVKRKKVTVITGRKGLKVTVNPSALETEDGKPVNGNITVKMVELTTSNDLFKSNAATVSNGKLLASGGSYFVGMECNGKTLHIKGNQAIQMEFPKIKEEGMELFYGEKDENNSINWVSARQKLMEVINAMDKSIYSPPYPGNEDRKRFKSWFRLYEKLDNKVYYQKKLVTIKDMVDKLHQNGVDKNIDTLLIPAYEFYYGLTYNPNFKYDTVKRYRIVSCCDIERNNDSVAEYKRVTALHDEANQKYYQEWLKANSENSLEEKMTQYYAPASVSRLGWINCDRFYQGPQNIEAPVEVPNVFTSTDVKYFIIYKSFNGLMSGMLIKNAANQYFLKNLPQDQDVTLIVFAKQDGKIYYGQQDFVTSNIRIVKPDYRVISVEEMTKMFAPNS